MLRQRYIIPLFLFLLVVFFPVPSVRADTELVVSGNGAQSANQAVVTSSPVTSVQQSNNATVTNDVKTTANTGGNTASSNSGQGVSVSTGNAGAQTTVTNSANSSTVSQDCGCSHSGGTSVTVSGNGAGSVNSGSLTSVGQNTVVQSNNAVITTNIHTTANTGDNVSNNNTGDVSIHTGSIWTSNLVTNAGVNVSEVSLGDISSGSVNVKVAGNGANSVNSVSFGDNAHTNVFVTNNSTIINNLQSDLGTGKNVANGNSGRVDIATGDILAETQISNVVNVSTAEVNVCKESSSSPSSPSTPTTPTNTSNSTPSAPASPAGVGSTSPAVAASTSTGSVVPSLGNLLPATGTNWLFFAVLGNIMMFFLGAYLRLRSGRSPGFLVAAY